MSSEEKHPRRDHERTDWNATVVGLAATLLVIAVAIGLLGAWWIFRDFQATASQRMLGTARLQQLPPEPRLQVSPTAEWTEMFKKEQTTLNTYGWVDRSRGIVRIPIQRAMQLMTQGQGKNEGSRQANEARK